MLTGFADGLEGGCESKKAVKANSKVFGLNNWKETFANKGGRVGKTVRETGLGKGESEAQF